MMTKMLTKAENCVKSESAQGNVLPKKKEDAMLQAEFYPKQYIPELNTRELMRLSVKTLTDLLTRLSRSPRQDSVRIAQIKRLITRKSLPESML